MKLVLPSYLKGKINAPSSKSYTQRAIAIAALAKGKSVILNPSLCDDSLAAISIARNIGAEISIENNSLKINGSINLGSNIWDCNESGLCLRMFAPVAALFDKEIKLSGNGSLLSRPVDMIEKSLSQAGVEIYSNKGLPPLKIKGPIKNHTIITESSTSSQFLTGLLIALPFLNGEYKIISKKIVSKPYIDMTLETIKNFGVIIKNNNYQEFIINNHQSYKPAKFNIEGDWSNAAYFMVAGAINGEINISGLKINSLQGDKKILDVLINAGADIKVDVDGIFIRKSNLKCFNFNAIDYPDLFPPLVVLAGYCNGISEIKGVSRLINKESNRAEVLKNEFSKIGYKIEIKDNSMFIKGGSIKGGSINPNNDHRIAMAAAIAALKAEKPVTIENPGCVAKSYPGFFKDFSNLGLIIKDIK
ncbi:MAG: 3-phosphoshikimate 1-carboxyvinyltransferase [Marinilabiliales bacterium]